MDRYIRYTIKSAYGEHRAYLVDDSQREAVRLLTGAKSLTRKAAQGLKALGFEMEYAGDVSYEDDPIYPHGEHRAAGYLSPLMGYKAKQ
jgi:hypothetical protein